MLHDYQPHAKALGINNTHVITKHMYMYNYTGSTHSGTKHLKNLGWARLNTITWNQQLMTTAY